MSHNVKVCQTLKFRHEAKLRNKVHHMNLKLTKGWGFNSQQLQIFKIHEMDIGLTPSPYTIPSLEQFVPKL